MSPLSFTTPRTARYLLLGEPGAAIEQVWVCLHGHGQPVAALAEQLHHLDTPERLLLLPEALSRYEVPTVEANAGAAGAAWFAPDSLLADLTDLGAYLDALTREGPPARRARPSRCWAGGTARPPPAAGWPVTAWPIAG